MLTEADELFANGRLEDAAILYQRYSQSNPNELGGWLGICRVASRRRDWAIALAAWSDFLAKFPGRLDGRYEKAQVLTELSRYAEAYRMYKDIQESHPAEPHGWLGIARVAMLKSEWALALQMLDHVLTLFPDRADALYQKTQVLLEIGKIEEAEPLLKQLLNFPYPYSTASYYPLIKLYQKGSRLADARKLTHDFFALNSSTLTKNPERNSRILVFGESHIGGIQSAYKASNSDAMPIDFIKLPAGQIDNGSSGLADGYHDIPNYQSEYSISFISIGGNEHTTFGLGVHPEPYWFGRKEVLDLAKAEVPYISYYLIRESLWERMKPFEHMVRFLATILPYPMFMIESPPPSPSSDHITSTIDKDLKERMIAYGVSDKYLRYEYWRMRSSFAESLSLELGMKFVKAPSESFDNEGFLSPEYWGNATHGNDLYGKLVLDQIRTIAQGV